MDRRRFLGSTAAALAMPAIARADAAPIKVAFMATLSGPGAALGVHMRDGWQTALKQLGGKFGGTPVETLVIDDELKPETAVTKVGAALERDKVDVVAGVVFSNILASIYRPVTENKTFLISTNAGPSTFAGKGCSPWFFNSAYQNDQPHAAMGQAARDFGFKRVMILVPNYQAGKDAVAGFRGRFKGEVVDEIYVALNQLDFAAEVAKIAAAKPDAVFAFMPGGLGVALVRQYRQAGLGDIPFLSTFTVDEAALPAHKDLALGFYSVAAWAPSFTDEPSKRFIADFMGAYDYVPSNYAAQAYDAAMMLNAAVTAVGGKMSDKAGLKAAMEKADFPSLRPGFKMGANHFPVQDFWLCKVVKRPDGRFQTATERKILTADVDSHAADCKMPPMQG
jgi:branched-chain amino acid transport system substrate-binding protein